MYNYKGKKKADESNLLSLSRNLRRDQVQLNVNKQKTDNSKGLQSSLKSILEVYLKDNKKFINYSAAYALGLVNTRAIMLQKTNKLFEVSDSLLEKIKNKVEIKYIKLQEEKVERQSIQIFLDEDGNQFISSSAAFALSIIDVEVFWNSDSSYYQINDNIKTFLESCVQLYD